MSNSAIAMSGPPQKEIYAIVADGENTRVYISAQPCLMVDFKGGSVSDKIICDMLEKLLITVAECAIEYRQC